MRVVGYCTGCHTFKYVRVSPTQLALGAAIGGVCEGICTECEQAEEAARGREHHHDRNHRVLRGR